MDAKAAERIIETFEASGITRDAHRYARTRDRAARQDHKRVKTPHAHTDGTRRPDWQTIIAER